MCVANLLTTDMAPAGAHRRMTDELTPEELALANRATEVLLGPIATPELIAEAAVAFVGAVFGPQQWGLLAPGIKQGSHINWAKVWLENHVRRRHFRSTASVPFPP